MQNIILIESQIKAIIKAIAEGKCKNVWAAKNKIKTLKIRMEQIKYQIFLAK